MGADLATQSLQQESLDTQRSVAFFGFGLTGGAAGYFVYVSLFSRIFPCARGFASASWQAKVHDRKGQLDVIKQVLADLLVFTPCWYFPNFYLFKACLQSDVELCPSSLVVAAADTYRQTWKEDNLLNCAIWAPAGILLFSVPAWVRMPAMNSVNFLYTMLLSRMRGGGGKSAVTDAGQDVAIAVQGHDFSGRMLLGAQGRTVHCGDLGGRIFLCLRDAANAALQAISMCILRVHFLHCSRLTLLQGVNCSQVLC
jgi:hypothetical protein